MSATLRRRSAGVPMAVDAQPLADAVADELARVERGEGVLEDDLHAPPIRLQRLALQGRDVRAVEDDPPGRGVDEPQQQSADGRLAAPRLAHQAEGLAAGDLEVHAIHGAHLGHRALQHAGPDGEGLAQSLEADQGARGPAGAGRGPQRRALASRRSRCSHRSCRSHRSRPRGRTCPRATASASGQWSGSRRGLPSSWW